jgi:hypothetical protein
LLGGAVREELVGAPGENEEGEANAEPMPPNDAVAFDQVINGTLNMAEHAFDADNDQPD